MTACSNAALPALPEITGHNLEKNTYYTLSHLKRFSSVFENISDNYWKAYMTLNSTVHIDLTLALPLIV